MDVCPALAALNPAPYGPHRILHHAGDGVDLYPGLGQSQHRLSTTICTDNRTVSNTTVTRELMLAVEHLGLDLHDLKSIIIYGFKRSFWPGTYLEKRAYVREVIDYYEKMEKEHLGPLAV